MSQEETSVRDYLAWLASVPPAKREEERGDWRLMEAERLERMRNEELCFEPYGC